MSTDQEGKSGVVDEKDPGIQDHLGTCQPGALSQILPPPSKNEEERGTKYIEEKRKPGKWNKISHL